MRILLLLALCCTPLAAQGATFTSYSQPCATNTRLDVTGLPKIGGSFTVGGIITPFLCTRKFCGCNVGVCNTCRGSILVMGVQRINVMVGPCALRTLPLLLVPGSGKITISVPNNAALFGTKFQMQRADVAMNEVIDSTCKKNYVPTAINSLSDAVEGYVAF